MSYKRMQGLIGLMFFASAAVYGQATDSNLTGTVSDASGAFVAGAQLHARLGATAAEYTATTNSSGVYRINNIPAGQYSITTTAAGFGTATLQNVDVALNQTATVNISLQVAGVSTTVEVRESSTVIDTTTAQVQSTFGERASADLPLTSFGLGVLNLSLLSAGVGSSGGYGLGEGPSVGGQRPRDNSFNVDGVDNNRRDVSGSNVRIPNDAVEEFSVLQNQFSAEFGHAGGGVFNTILKSGTNTTHGLLYEYFQNRNLNAEDESYKRQQISSIPRLDDNRLGASIGGPIVKNKLFYYGLMEYHPTGQASSPSNALQSPTADGYAILGSIAAVSKTNLGVLQKYSPAAPAQTSAVSVGGMTIPVGDLPINFPSFQNRYNIVISSDYTVSSRDQLRGRWASNDTTGIDPTVSAPLPAFVNNRTTTNKLFSLSEFHTFTPSLTNEFRFGYSRYNDDIPAGSYPFPGLDVFPELLIQSDNFNTELGPFNGAPQSTILNAYQFTDNLNWNKGRHTLKFGWEGRKYISSQFFTQRVRGDYEYSSLERFLLDLTPDLVAERSLGAAPYSGNAISNYAYVNDSYRLRSNLTVNLGLRYEYKGISSGDREQALNAISSVPGLIDFRAPRPQKLNFAPRIGLAYSPGSSGKTSIRAGFGMSYDNAPDNFGLLATPPQLSVFVDDDTSLSNPNYLGSGGISPSRVPPTLDAAAARANTAQFTPDQKLPQAYQWNVGVQRVFHNDYTFEARYLGTRGVHLYVQQRLNIQSPVTSSQYLPTYLTAPSQQTLDSLPLTLNDLQAIPFYTPQWAAAGFGSTSLTAEQNIGNSTYHGLALELTRRFSRGFLFKGAYTWSHSIDDSTADLNSTAQAPRRAQDFGNLRSERGNSFLDHRHRLSVSWVYDTPWFKNSNWLARNLIGNWTLGGDYIYESPQFATAQSGLDSNMNNDSAGDRTIVNPAGTAGTGSGVTALTNSAGDIVAYLADNPSARYIVAGRGALATGGRGTLPLRPINNWDLNLGKQFAITERMKLDFRGLLINAFNHPQYTAGYINDVGFTPVANTVRSNTIPSSPLFNDPTRVFPSNARVIQIVGRLSF